MTYRNELALYVRFIYKRQIYQDNPAVYWSVLAMNCEPLATDPMF